MAEEGQGLSAYFPPPPPFYKHFTTKNLERLEELKASANAESSENEPVDSSIGLTKQQILELPTELRYLIPPEPPADGKCRLFGEEVDVSKSQSKPGRSEFRRLTYNKLTTAKSNLRDIGITRLYPSPPSTPSQADGIGASFSVHHAFYLKRIMRSILLNFLDLVGVMSEDPQQGDAKISDLETLFLNAHQLVNEYRPHQARETLILQMEEQIERKRKEIEGVKTMKMKIDEMFHQLKKEAEDLPKTAINEDTPKSEEDIRREKVKALWSCLDDMDD
jgi:mediator of RNA polymerase II transcription subunit 7